MVCSVNIRTEQKGDWYVKFLAICRQGRLPDFVCNFSKPDSRTCLFASGARGNQSRPQDAEVDPQEIVRLN